MVENKSLRWMCTVIGFIVVLGAAVGFWLHSINTLPVVNIPTPVMPSPNAYDYFVNAGNAIVDGDKVAKAVNIAASGGGSASP